MIYCVIQNNCKYNSLIDLLTNVNNQVKYLAPCVFRLNSTHVVRSAVKTEAFLYGYTYVL